MECKQCGTVLEGRQREYCSDKCRKRASRTKSTPEDGSQSTNADKTAVEPGQIERGQPAVCGIIPEGSREDYTARPYAYAIRAVPDKLNWGPWMNSQQLAEAGLKANRVGIPGDWDYVPEPAKAISALSDAGLLLRLKLYEGTSWVNSPEHKEVLKRRAAQPTGAWT